MNVKYCSEVKNTNHPQILYWFWTADMVEEKTYIEELENIYNTMSFDLLFLTSRDGLSFFDNEEIAKPFEETVERAHELGIRIGLQLWRNEGAATLKDAVALIVEGEEPLDDDGELYYVAESYGHRDQESLKTELFKVVLFKKTGVGTYEKDTIVDITDQCKVEYVDAKSIEIKIAAGKAYEGYTAYILTAHYHKSPDIFGDFSINSLKQAMDTFSDVPFDGVGLDEFKSMPILPPWITVWHNFRSRIYGKAFHKYFNETCGMDLKDIIFEMRYVAEGEESVRMKAINYYFDVMKNGVIRVENFLNDYAKKLFGEDIFIGLHNTYHNKLTNDELWETGCMWWDLPRDYGQTDEDIAYPVRMGIGYSHKKPIVYDMYYTEGEKMPIYKKAIKDARYNNRIHYHAYNDRRPNRFNMKNEEFSETVIKIEEKVKLLNYFDGPLPKLDLLIVFGRPALANWFPNYQNRNEYDINGNLRIIEKSQALWDAGVMCGLVPSNKIEQEDLIINEGGKIEYHGHTFDKMLFLYPEYSKQTTLDFLEKCAATDNLLLIEGTATHDFEGNSCSEQFNRIADKAEVIEFSVAKILEKGIETNDLPQGSRLQDGSVILTDLKSIMNNKPLKYSIEINEHTYSGDYIGTMAIKMDNNNCVEKFVAGGFTKLYRDNELIISLEAPSDIIIKVSEEGYDVTVINENSKPKLIIEK